MMELLREYALQFVGLPYKWGGDDPILGFDCSGLTQELLACMNEAPETDSNAQSLYNHFLKVGFPGRTLGLGALCFYGKSVKEITHVAMMLSETEIIEAGGGGSKTNTAADAAAQNAYIRIRRFDRRKDLVAVIMPKYGRMK